MPEHTSFITYLLAMFPALGENMHNFGETFYKHRALSAHDAEPVFTSVLLMLIIIGLAFVVRGKLADTEKAVIPDDKLTLRTFFEIYVGYWYNMMKGMMGPARAKRYFPLIGTLSIFIIFSNVLGLIPGMIPPTSSLSVTFGCSIVVFLAFNYYGIKENGLGYFKHMCGPWLGWGGLLLNILVFGIEVISTCMRPITLGVRLMLNIAVDHLLGSIMLGMVALFVPIPIMMLGTLVCVVQVIVFCLLSSIYITLATENLHHGDEHGHGHAHTDDHGKAAGHGAAAHA